MRIVGIDLGTTNSLVAYMDGGVPRVIPGPNGRALLPSVVAWTDKGLLVGDPAKEQLLRNPERTVYSVKRLMGKSLSDLTDELKYFPYPLSEQGGVIRLHIAEKTYSPQQISAMILKELKRWAEAFLHEDIGRAVITVPAYFNDSQRQATKDAGMIAGLDVVRIINEPTAASLAYGLQRRTQGIIAVYDLGGGTFDISILKLKDGIFEVLSTNGNTHLGGDDFDRIVAEVILRDIREQHGLDLEEYDDVLQAVRLEAEQIKIRLSDSLSARALIELPRGKGTYQRSFSRDELERLTGHLVEQTLDPCRQALRDAGLKASDIDEVILVGGATRMPLVKRRVQDLFGRTPHSELNPDEVVALGAAVQADILSGSTQGMLLLDVTPLSLGIETMGGVMSTLIPRNTTIPASAKEVFTTSVDGQTGVDIHILQGERELAKDNRSLARFRLKVPPLPAGVPRIEVTFLIDANGILNVTARDLRTGESQSIEVKPSSGLTEEEVEQMIRDSFTFAAEDLKARQLIEARTEANTILAATDKALAQGSHLIEQAEIEAIRHAQAALKAAVAGEDYGMIRDKIAELEQITRHLAEVLMEDSLKQALHNKSLSELP
jgi:Fe-S protein assembly chaperone HscA